MSEPDTYPNRIRATLAGIIDDWADSLHPMPPTTSPRTTKTATGSATPLALDALSLRAEIHHVLHAWTATVRWSDPSATPPASDATVDLAEWLRDYAVWLAEWLHQQPDRKLTLPRLERRARQLHLLAGAHGMCAISGCQHPTPPPIDLGMCPDCGWGYLTPVFVEGVRTGDVECTRQREPHAPWWWWAKLHGHDPEETVTRVDLAAALRLSLNALDLRVHRGQLTPVERGVFWRWEAAYYVTVAGWPRRAVAA